jgi:hypothetical protein
VEEYNEREMAGMRKSIILCVALMMILSMPTAMAAITVDGYKQLGEWNEDWAFAQYQATTYIPSGPFGDRLVVRQGLYEGPYATTIWNDIDPKNDSGELFNASMATLGESSGYDIGRIYTHYDLINDTVYGLTEVYGIPGDLDGDGNVSTVGPGDTEGLAGPAGVGLGDNEYWCLRMIKDGTSTSVKLEDNDWTITGNGLTYNDIVARFTSNQSNSVYEISLSNISEHYTIEPGTVLAMELIAGSSADIPGEDSATVFIQLPDPDIRIVKYVQGMDGIWYDANTPTTGPVMANGSAVSWKYVITNTGDEPLVLVNVVDDQGVVVPGQQNTLAIGETVTYTADGAVPDPCVPYVNVGYVEGYGVATGFKVTDTDPANYVCKPVDVPALTPTGLLGLIGVLGIIGIIGMKRRD